MTATTLTSDTLSRIRYADVRAIALLADALGWRVNIPDSGKGVRFSHQSGDNFQLATNDNMQAGKWVAKIKHVCRLASAAGGVALTPTEARDVVEWAIDQAGLRRVPAKRFREAVADIIDVAAPVEQRPAPKPYDRFADDEPAAEPVAAPGPIVAQSEPPKPKPGRHIVSIHPARAIRVRNDKGAITYESPTALERSWSDGTKDYPCKHEGCDFVGDSLKATGSHYRVHQVTERPPADGFDPERPAETSGRVSRLAAEIRAAISAGVDPGDADALAGAIIEARRARGVIVDGETAELTADEALNLIARIVDRGKTPALEDENEQLRERLDALEASEQRAWAQLNTLRDLLGEVTAEHEKGD